jgi:glycosyltransferase involved in cell wall biosynthesis
MLKISIIVPIYNSDKFLGKCINSILSQSLSDLEVLLIDDGSFDSSCQICDNYSTKDKRIKVFHKENGGVSSARNLGIKNACGEYICFVDSDDLLEFDYLEKLYKYKSYDLVFCGNKNIDGEDNVTLIHSTHLLEANEYNSMGQTFINIESTKILDTPWAKLFKKSIIEKNNILFDLQVSYGEDKLFVFNYLVYVKDFIQIPYSGYLYRNLSNSSKIKFTYDKRMYQTLSNVSYFELIAKNWKINDKKFNNRVKQFYFDNVIWSILSLYQKNTKQIRSIRLSFLKSLNSDLEIQTLLSFNRCWFKKQFFVVFLSKTKSLSFQDFILSIMIN